MTESCPTRLLPDEPSDVDAFGSHQRVARAIASLVTDELGGRSIALTGSYGSGKSTVVRLLTKLLGQSAASPHLAVFVFDAWAHQGDVLRRAFLENLVTFLTRIGWTTTTRWQSTLELLTGRREQSESTSEPVLTKAGRLVGACALLIAPGAALVSKAGDKASFLGMRAWVWGLIFCMAPLIAALTTWGFWRPTWKMWRAHFWTQHRAPHESESVLSFFIQKIRETHRISTVHTPDPTSVEFRELFLKIVESVLAEPEQRRLIIVVDNLDRLGPTEAAAMWATMRTFVDWETLEGHPTLSRLWLLVPFDTKAVHRLIGLTTATDTSESEAAFLNKSFQATFRVPPPVVSYWRRFLDDSLATAFPDVKHREDFQAIFGLYRFKRGLLDTLMTPREIKLFVNKLGGLHRQWCGEISLPLQALHVLHEDDISDASKDLSRDGLLAPLEVALIGVAEWQRYLAALHYNVPPTESLQVLLGSTIEAALVAGSATTLQPLKSIAGFGGVCEQVLQRNYVAWAAQEPGSLASAALALAELDGSGGSELRPTWDWLRSGLLLIQQWPALRETTGLGLVEILHRFPSSEADGAAAHTLKTLRDGAVVADAQPSVQGQVTSRMWVRAVAPVVGALDHAGRAEIIEKNLTVPGGAPEYVGALFAIAELPGAGLLVRYFRPRVSAGDILTDLVARCTNGRFTPETVRAVPLLGTVSPDLQWEPLVAALNQRLQAGNALQAPEITGCVSALLFLAWRRGNAQASSVAQTLAAQGHVLHQIYQARAVKDAEAVGVCALLVLMLLPAGNVQAQVGNSNAGLGVYQELLRSPSDNAAECAVLAKLVVELGRFDELLSVRTAAPNTSALVSAVLELIASREDAFEIVTPEKLVSHYVVLEEILSGETLRSLIAQLVSKGKLVDHLTAKELLPQLGALYALTEERADAEQRAGLEGFLNQGLQSVRTEIWLQALGKEEPLIALLLELLQTGAVAPLGSHFEDALLAHAQAVMRGEVEPVKYKDKWSRLGSGLPAALREDLLRNIRDAMLVATTPLGKMLALWGESLIEEGALEEKADEIVRRLARAVVERVDSKEVEWLTAAFERRPAILSACARSSKEALSVRVVSALRATALEVPGRSALEELGRSLEIDPEHLPEEPEESSATSGP